MVKNKLFKIMWIISMIVEILVFIMVNFIYKNTYEVYNSTNYLALAAIELINIIFGILLFNKKNNKLIKILYIVFIIITFFIPIYHNGDTYAPTGPGSELMGLAFKERYLNVYGINIIRIFEFIRWF